MGFQNVRAVLTGLLVDLAGSFAAAVVIVTVYTSILQSQGMDMHELEKRLSDPASLHDLLLILVSVGVFFDGLAGYITARMAPGLEMWHVLALVVILTLIHLYFHEDSTVGEGYRQVAWLLGSAAALAGGYFSKSRKHQGEGSD